MCDISKKHKGRKPKYIYKVVIKNWNPSNYKEDLEPGYYSAFVKSIIKENSYRGEPHYGCFSHNSILEKYNLITGFKTIKAAKLVLFWSKEKYVNSVIVRIKVHPKSVIYYGTGKEILSYPKEHYEQLCKEKTYAINKWTTIEEIN